MMYCFIFCRAGWVGWVLRLFTNGMMFLNCFSSYFTLEDSSGLGEGNTLVRRKIHLLGVPRACSCNVRMSPLICYI